MTQQQRAKQFMPLDALQGLQEALRDREERHLREDKRELSDEVTENNSKIINKIHPGMKVKIRYYHAFHDVEITGVVCEVSLPFRTITVEDSTIHIDDIYRIKILEFTDHKRKG